MGFEFGSKPSAARSKGFMNQPAATDPLAGVEYTDNVEADSAAELDALARGFRERRKLEDQRFKQATDSEFWAALCFRSREHKEAFIKAAGAARLGDKYIDGHAFAKLLGIDLPE